MKQDESVELCSVADRLERFRIATQATWADVAKDIGLSQSMIYQVKSGARQLSPKAEYRLAAAERKAGLAPPITTATIAEAGNADDGIKVFAKATASEQLSMLKREPGLWNLWFEMHILGLFSDVKENAEKAQEIADLAKALDKEPTNKKNKSHFLALVRSHAETAQQLKERASEDQEIILEIASELRLAWLAATK
ncbi:MAG: hypothetical protein EON58_14320 [Alphaproteobacteria bacterium]|nr:MAG: hypothetical protein EON58_14320 [Alphaproteobacteria bacterium]